MGTGFILFRWLLLAGTSLGLAGNVFAQIPLVAYNVDPSQVSVSGFSSGAFMAQQLGVAYSSRFMGVGFFAGYQYDCRRTQSQAACYGATIPDISGSRLNMNAWSGTLIDPVANIAHQRIYAFSGLYDVDVPQSVVNQAVNLLEVYAPGTNIRYDNNLPVGHVFPTDIGAAFDGAGVSLQWFYGTLKPRNTGAPTGSLFMIDQGAFAPRGIGLDKVAWLYVPEGCARGEICKLHVFLHGCGTSYAQTGTPVWADYSGHRMWADTNNIILLFPQVLPDAMHPEGCWDSNAWYGSDYDQKSGVQMTAIMAMIAKITSGYLPSTPNNFQGLWWNAAESGWGINLAHQGDTVFASWFTYDLAGRVWWLVMTASKTGPNTYQGDLYETMGPAFNAQPFDPTKVASFKVGTGTLTFSDANNGRFDYTVNSVHQVAVSPIQQFKSITREVFGPLPTCTWGGQPNLALATNYQDLWWAGPPPGVESGWGINLNHEGDKIFATWFTYDLGGAPMWLVVTAPKTDPGKYSGDLYRTTGPAFNAMPFNPLNVIATKVGTANFTFADGNDATFHYTVQFAQLPGPVDQSKSIVREIFAAPGTACQ
jgi:hypothetical protein